MTSLTERLQHVRTLRSQVEPMYQSMAAPTRLPGRVSGSMAIKMVYEQANREEHAARFKAVLDDLDQQEQEILTKLEAQEVAP